MVILNIILRADVYVHLITVGSNEGHCVVGERQYCLALALRYVCLRLGTTRECFNDIT